MRQHEQTLVATAKKTERIGTAIKVQESALKDFIVDQTHFDPKFEIF